MSSNATMDKVNGRSIGLVGRCSSFVRACIFRVLCAGPIPTHYSFIMDGNRRYARKMNMEEGAGHRAGFFALVSVLKCCYELGVKYISIYAFSIDNFKRRPDEVKTIMDLILEKTEGLLEEGSIADQFGVRVYFVGNLKLLNERMRNAAEEVMKATAHNSKCILLICIAYTSYDEIVHSVRESCKDELVENGGDEVEHCSAIEVVDIEKHMYMAVAPDPDILLRSSGEMRLSNYLLWQTTYCTLYSPKALWPEIGLWHVLWGVLKFQRSYAYFEKKKTKKIA
ncbi:Dehydrodolichyl diphosphate synthase CPT3 [Linum grandiflorum]